MAGSKSMEVAIIDRAAALAPSFTPAQVELVKAQFAKGATDDELVVLLTVADKYGLDPIAREIWFAKFEGDNKPGTTYVGRDGLLAVAERSGQFDGLVSGAVYTADTFEFGIQEPVHVFGQDYTVKMADGSEETKNGRGSLAGAYAYVYRKDRKYPFRIYAEWRLYGFPKVRNPDGSIIAYENGKPKPSSWSKFPSAMLRKVAEANALRLAFRVSGVVAEGEPNELDDEVVDAEVVEDHRRPVGYPAETGSTPTPDDRPASDPLSEEPDGSHLSGAGSDPVPGGDELFPDDDDPEAAA